MRPISGADADAQQTTRHSLRSGNGAFRFSDLFQRRLAFLPKKLTFVGDLNTSRCAGKEPYTQTVLQSADGPADRSRSQTEELRRRSEAAQFRRLAKLLDAAELHGVHARHNLFQNVMNEVIL